VIERQPVVTSLDPQEFSEGAVTKGPMSTNAVWSKYADGRSYASQRPAVNIVGMAAERGKPSKGRGIVYWDKVAGEASNGIYFVNNDTVYAGSYDNPVTTKITAGRDPIHFVEAGNYLVIVDVENNQAWYLDSAAPEQMFQINDINFPGINSNAQLAGGGAELDGFLFVMDTDGRIYNSDLNDVTSWSALGFLDAQREQDAGVYLTKHHDHVCAIGSNSIEFFYNAGNPTGSPLARRPDVSYRTGALDFRNVFSSGERIYFIGSEKIGTPGVYQISGFELTRISTDSLDRFLSKTRVTDAYKFNMTGGYIGEHYFTFINTLAPEDGAYTPKYTFYYDATHKLWGAFETDVASVNKFAMSGISERSAILRGESIIMFMSGDLGVFDMTGTVLDTSGEDGYVVDGFISPSNDAYVAGGISGESTNIDMSITTNEMDFGSLTNKFMYRFSLAGNTVGSETDESAPIRVSWTDDVYKTFSTPKFYDAGNRRSLVGLGKFKRRAFKFDYSGEDRLRLEQMEMDVEGSDFA